MNKQKAKPDETSLKSKPREAAEVGIAKDTSGSAMLGSDSTSVLE
jgi:hypothetical protein